MAEEKLLRDIIDQVDQQNWPPAVDTLSRRSKERMARRADDLLVPVARLTVKETTMRVPVERPLMTTPEKVLAIFRSILEDLPHEEVHVMTLDANLRYINTWKVAQGGYDHANVEPREVFTAVLAKDGAAYFIPAHNHPKMGDPTPSPEDFEMLEDLKKGGLYLRCPMRDFIVIGTEGRYYSHREKGYEL